MKSKEKKHQQIKTSFESNKLIILLSGENSYFYQEILDEINSLKVGKKVSGKKLSGFDAISRSTFWSEFMTLTFLSGLKFE